jgi:hypothetical protein
MKTYRDFITEAATAKAKSKKNFKKKWNKLLDSPAWQKAPDNVAQWHLTGHNADARHGSTKEVEKTKEKIFGKRKGNSHLFWIHSHHGLITHPAHGDIVHNDVELSPRKGIKVDKNIRKKVKDTSGLIVGLGRIEHHEGGGGMISYGHIGGSTRSAAVRTIARAYPKHKIHDGHGNLLEATAVVKAKKPPLSYADKFKKLRGILSKSNDLTAQVVSGKNSGWSLTGHDTDSTLSNETIRKAKDRVFGKRQGDSQILFFHKTHGIVTHPAIGDLTHQDIHTNAKHLRHHIDQNVRAKVTGTEKADLIGQGRIEHHKNGGGMISIVGRNHKGDEAPVHPSVLRTLRRAYPKHFIHDGLGNELHENQIQEAYISKTKDGWIHSRGLGHRRWVKGNHSIEKQGKRGWTVYDWHSSKELHVAKTAKEAKAWSNANRPSHSKMEPIEIKPWTA